MRSAEMSTRDVIVAVFKQVAADQGRTLAPLSDAIRIAECGLDSLSLALVVAILEDSLAVDPFSSEELVDFPITFGDFVRMYNHTVA
jgi:hypothetical protein